MKNELKYQKVYKELIKLLKKKDKLSLTEQSSIFYVLSQMFLERKDYIKNLELMEIKNAIRFAVQSLDQDDESLSRNAISFLGTLGRLREEALDEDTVDKVTNKTLKMMEKPDIESRLAALYVLQTDIYLRKAIEINPNLPCWIVDLIWSDQEVPDIRETALHVTRRAIFWRNLPDESKEKLVASLFEFLDKETWVPTVLHTLLLDHIVEVLAVDQRRRVAQWCYQKLLKESPPSEIYIACLHLLEKQDYWEVLEEKEKDTLFQILVRYLENSSPKEQASILWMFCQEHVMVILKEKKDLIDQLTKQGRRLFEGTEVEAIEVRRNALCLLAEIEHIRPGTYFGAIKQAVADMLRSKEPSDQKVALLIVQKLADQWETQEIMKFMECIWQMLDKQNLASLAWPTYARLIVALDGKVKNYQEFVNSLIHRIYLKLQNYPKLAKEVFYGIIDALEIIVIASLLNDEQCFHLKILIQDLKLDHERLRMKVHRLLNFLKEKPNPR